MRVLITGVAGFIGFHMAKRMLLEGHTVVGIDNLNDYYDINLKNARTAQLNHEKFTFYKENIENQQLINELFVKHNFEIVIHLAAQAGVRYSISNPDAYISSNLIGFFNILENCRQHKIKHFLYASSSSVYGRSEIQPLSTDLRTDQPLSLYAATKKSNELMAYSYSHLYDLPSTGLRFFSVYGPWGRPDMALFKFTESIINDEVIDVYNSGKMLRDFTYIDDIVESIVRLVDKIPIKNNQAAPYKVLNIGNHQPITLNGFIQVIEKVLGKQAVRNNMPMQPGDVENTFAKVDDLQALIGFKPNTEVEKGVEKFINWYKAYYLEKSDCYV